MNKQTKKHNRKTANYFYLITMHLRPILTKTMNLQLTHTRKTHRIRSTTAPMPQGKYVENRFNQSLKCKAAQQV